MESMAVKLMHENEQLKETSSRSTSELLQTKHRELDKEDIEVEEPPSQETRDRTKKQQASENVSQAGIELLQESGIEIPEWMMGGELKPPVGMEEDDWLDKLEESFKTLEVFLNFVETKRGVPTGVKGNSSVMESNPHGRNVPSRAQSRTSQDLLFWMQRAKPKLRRESRRYSSSS